MQVLSDYHLRNIGKVRKYLDESPTETLIHAFVTSKYQINSLQLVLNTAARVVTHTCKYEHITPVLIGLHWLRVSYRITFKILLLTYKALNTLPNVAMSGHSDLAHKNFSVFPDLGLPITYGDRAFSIAGTRLWNELPLTLYARPPSN